MQAQSDHSCSITGSRKAWGLENFGGLTASKALEVDSAGNKSAISVEEKRNMQGAHNLVASRSCVKDVQTERSSEYQMPLRS